MARPGPPEPVKFLVAVLGRDGTALSEARESMTRCWGEIDFEGPPHPFRVTDYYEREMGTELERRILSFSPLKLPEELVPAKLAAIEIEEALSSSTGRQVNLDVGYLDFHKVVLASVKYGPMKVHLGRGIYADLVCRFFEGEFRHLEWTFQDFRDGIYDGDLLEIRKRYRLQLARPGPQKE